MLLCIAGQYEDIAISKEVRFKNCRQLQPFFIKVQYKSFYVNQSSVVVLQSSFQKSVSQKVVSVAYCLGIDAKANESVVRFLWKGT